MGFKAWVVFPWKAAVVDCRRRGIVVVQDIGKGCLVCYGVGFSHKIVGVGR